MLRRRMLNRSARTFLLVAWCGLAGFCCKTQPKSTPTLHVLLDWQPTPSFIGFYVADDRGFYERAGIHVEFDNGTGAADATKLVASGKYPVGTSSGQATALARAGQAPVRSIAVLYPNVPTVMMSLPAKPIRTPQDLLGKTIGVNAASATYSDLQALLSLKDINRKLVTQVGIGWDIAPLLAHKVDGVMDYAEQAPVELKAKGYDVVTMAFRDNGLQCYGFNVIANEGALRASDAVIEAFRTATIQGYEYVRQHPDEAVQIFVKRYPERNAAFVAGSVRAVVENLGPGVVGKQDVAGWTATIATLRSAGTLTQPLVAADIIAP